MKKIIITISIIILIILLGVVTVCFLNRETLVAKTSKFKNIYKNNDFSNYDLYIHNILSDDDIPVNSEDKNFILESIKNCKIKPIHPDYAMMGGYCRFVLIDKNTNKTFAFALASGNFGINSKTYKTDNSSNIFNDIKNIVLKYNDNYTF